MSLSNRSISKEDIRYHIQDFDNELFLSLKFKWLDKWMLYLPLFVKTSPSRTPRSKYCKILIIFLIICTLFMLLEVTEGVVGGIKGSNNLILISSIVNAIIDILLRLSSLIYYYFYFNYPWHSKVACFTINVDEACTNNNKNCICIVKHYKLMIKIYVAIYVISFVLVMAGSSASIFVSEYHLQHDIVYMILNEIIYMMLLEIPNFFAIVIQSTICFKYYWYLSQLMNNMGDNMNINLLFAQYKKVYVAFKKDYNFYLKWTVILYIAQWLIEVFIGSNNPIYRSNRLGTFVLMSECGTLLIIFIQISLYVISAVLLSETFLSLQELLWQKINGFIGNGKEFKSQSILTSFIAYSAKYPVYISFAGILMTRRNIILFAIGYAAARIAALFYVLY